MPAPAPGQRRSRLSIVPDGREPCSITIDTVSPAVARVDATLGHLTMANRLWILFGIFVVCYVSSLDGILRFAWQPMAVSALESHSIVATISVVRSVTGAIAQPAAAKVADVFGRVEIVLLTAFFYAIGTAIEAAAPNVIVFAVGSIFYQTGYTTILLISEIIIADVTTLRARLFFSYVPAVPFCVNLWIGAEVLDLMVITSSWRWGIGIWAIIYPISTIPLIIVLMWVNHKTKQAGDLLYLPTPFKKYGGWSLLKALFWQLDIIGIVLYMLVIGLLLIPLNIAGGSGEAWNNARIIAPIMVGAGLLPVWIVWEKIAPHPMVPFFLLTRRAVLAPLGIAFFLMFAWGCQNEYLFTLLQIIFDMSEKAATRIAGLYSFSSTITGITVGLMVYRVRRLKPFIVFGTLTFMLAFGLMIYYRGDNNDLIGIVAAQLMLGISGGFFPYAAQASIQSAAAHEHTAVLTGLYLACFNVGSAFGHTAAGIIQNEILYSGLQSKLGSKEARMWTNDPYTMMDLYPLGTPGRNAVIAVYRQLQRSVCITGACVAIFLIGLAFCLRDPQLPDAQCITTTDPNKHCNRQSNETTGSADEECAREADRNARRAAFGRGEEHELQDIRISRAEDNPFISDQERAEERHP